MNIIILGDKFQKRMKSKGCVGLFKNNKFTTVIEHQYSVLNQLFPKAKIIYIYGFEAKRFEQYISVNKTKYSQLKILYNKNYELYNNAFSLYLAKEFFLEDDCLISFGDIVFNKKTFHRFDINLGSQVFLSSQDQYKLGCNISNKNILTNIDYELNNYIYNMYYISKNEGFLLYKLLKDDNNYNCFIFELINKLIEQKCIIKPFFIHNQKRIKLS